MASAPSTKRVMIDKANTTMVVFLAVASFIAVFSLVASRSLLSQRAYQERVINKKEKARDQLHTNVDNASQLKTSYQAFIGGSTNLLGGNPIGEGEKDGDNAKIVLDALPSSYDFPALATSVEKLMSQPGIKIQNITGTDDQLTQQTNESASIPKPYAMPFESTIEGKFSQISAVLDNLQQSIRPIQVLTLNMEGSQNDLTLTITAQSYFQPGVSLKNATEVVK